MASCQIYGPGGCVSISRRPALVIGYGPYSALRHERSERFAAVRMAQIRGWSISQSAPRRQSIEGAVDFQRLAFRVGITKREQVFPAGIDPVKGVPVVRPQPYLGKTEHDPVLKQAGEPLVEV